MLYHERSELVSPPFWSDLGGFAIVLYIIIGLFMFPMSEHLYYLEAIESLFLVRTRKKNLFPKSKKFKAAKIEDIKEMRNHYEP